MRVVGGLNCTYTTTPASSVSPQDGKVPVDPQLIQELVVLAAERAAERGAKTAMPRDVRDAADLLASRHRGTAAPVPNVELPEHHERLTAELERYWNV